MANSPPRTGIIAVAIDKDKHSPYAVRWAIDHLLPQGETLILLHVALRNTQNYTSGTSEVSFDEKNDPTKDAVFPPFRAYCTRKGVSHKEVIIEDNDISKAILNYISNNLISNIVLGASARSLITKKFKNHDVPTILNRYAPDFCSVYVITKGKTQSVRPAARPLANVANPPRLPSPRSLHDLSEADDVVRAQSLRLGPDQASRARALSTNLSLDVDMLGLGAKNAGSRVVPDSIDIGSIDLTAQKLDFTGVNDSPADTDSSSSTKDIEAQMKRLKLELKQTMDMYNNACKEAVSAKKKATELHQWKLEEARKFEQARLAEEAALSIIEKEKAKSKAALEAAEKAQKLAEMEVNRRKYAEQKAKREAEEKNRALDVLSNSDVRYRKYAIEEIETATNNFSPSLKVGEGGYGPVYKGKLDHTPVAIKVLRPDAKQGKKQFQQEVEILSCIRHPNMVLLLGACPEYGCLVYEYMNYGSLEDRLFRKGNTPPIPWRIRFKIAADIATGLLFLHQSKPEPLVHRDLKPGNILLDRNFVCKISDVGLARLVPPSVADSVTQYHMTSAAGTFCYIDPEYQQTGKLGTKSDVYSLGIMLLQIITARPPMGLTHQVDRAIEKGKFADFLDPAVPDWPVEEALEFAKMSLRCCELRKKDRPDLGEEILPLLTRLRNYGRKSRSSHGKTGSSDGSQEDEEEDF